MGDIQYAVPMRLAHLNARFHAVVSLNFGVRIGYIAGGGATLHEPCTRRCRMESGRRERWKVAHEGRQSLATGASPWDAVTHIFVDEFGQLKEPWLIGARMPRR